MEYALLEYFYTFILLEYALFGIKAIWQKNVLFIVALQSPLSIRQKYTGKYIPGP